MARCLPEHGRNAKAVRTTMVSHGYAWNRMEGFGDPLWEVWGVHEHGLVRGAVNRRLDRFVFQATAQRRNTWVRDTPAR
jgi:hypothetical protein